MKRGELRRESHFAPPDRRNRTIRPTRGRAEQNRKGHPPERVGFIFCWILRARPE